MAEWQVPFQVTVTLTSVVKTVKGKTNFQLYMNIITIITLEINYH